MEPTLESINEKLNNIILFQIICMVLLYYVILDVIKYNIYGINNTETCILTVFTIVISSIVGIIIYKIEFKWNK